MNAPPDSTDNLSNDPPPTEVTPAADLGLSGPTVRRTAGAVLSALLVVALLACGWLGWRETHGTDPSAASRESSSREAAVRAATDGLVAFHTIDYRHLDELIDRWDDLSAGKLHAMVGQGRKAVTRDLTRSKTVSEGTVDRAALSSFDPDAGEARVVALVTITSRNKGGKASSKVREFLCLVERGSDGWKMAAMQDLGGKS
ncbi:hypothetical protein [Nocardioides jensenii]|uniref:hypothetical protein n=1 Tax=Nocardioides jensenii TaxID=1843 RepID=UPI00082C158E|nr:hypothetical protein [Nocardioides jensenii]